MKYLKLFENYDDLLYTVVDHQEFNSFRERRQKMDIDGDLPIIKAIFKKVFGEVDPYYSNAGYDYKDIALYDDYGTETYAHFRMPMKLKDGTPPGMNIIKFDDDWYEVVYFPSHPNNINLNNYPPNINYKVDTMEGLEQLFKMLKDLN
jgi:hypothetical protein